MKYSVKRWIQIRKYCIDQSALSRFKQVYDYKDTEDGVYARWEELGLFQPAVGKTKSYSMLLPPPNVTGTLHLGHALTVTCQDIIARWQRMSGASVIWMPGVDHAGIATQAVVERMLGSRPEPQELDNALQNWSNASASTIKSQLRRLGASLHWPAFYYTLDKDRSEAVRDAFLQLWSAGLVVRRTALVNWSPALGSTISDIEVLHHPIQGPTSFSVPGYDKPVLFGRIFRFAYPLDRGGEVVVATTRPETMLGDICICVNPTDSRYANLIGSKAVHPFTGSLLPVVADDAVDPNFGTGALKVTPAHDICDFDIAARHKLPVIAVIGEDGSMNERAVQFNGMKRFDARSAVIEALSSKGLLRGIEDHKMDVPLCSRTSDVIELLPKPQWFIKCEDLAKDVVQRVQSGELQIEPEEHVKTFLTYMENIRDWCVSRQVQWGHRVPLSWSPSKEAWVPGDPMDTSLQPDPDVLDTWFSSSLLPFTALGWPKQVEQMKKYYPLDILVTGHDIVFFWVARMAMMALAITSQLPFKKVLLHGIICDSEGRKMSKSIGNVIDPLQVIDGSSLKEIHQDLQEKIAAGRLSAVEGERAKKHFTSRFPQGIPACGTDALRLTLMSTKVKRHFVEFDVSEATVMSQLCNKIWQAGRFVLGCGATEGKAISDIGFVAVVSGIAEAPATDRWLAFRLARTVVGVNNAIRNGEFHFAVSLIRQFIVNDFCDVYIEWCKVVLRDGSKQGELSKKLLAYGYLTSLRLLAPFAPFLTDRLYCHFLSDTVSIHSTRFPVFPEDFKFDVPFEDQFNVCLDVIKEVRRLKLSYVSSKLEVGLHTSSNFDWKEHLLLLRILTKASFTLLRNSDVKMSDWVLKAAIDVDTKLYLRPEVKQKEDPGVMIKRRDKLIKELTKLTKSMEHESYKEKVSEEVKKAHIEKVLRIKTELDRMQW